MIKNKLFILNNHLMNNYFRRIKYKNISDKECSLCVNAWKDTKTKAFKDLLEWHNNLHL